MSIKSVTLIVITGPCSIIIACHVLHSSSLPSIEIGLRCYVWRCPKQSSFQVKGYLPYSWEKCTWSIWLSGKISICCNFQFCKVMSSIPLLQFIFSPCHSVAQYLTLECHWLGRQRQCDLTCLTNHNQDFHPNTEVATLELAFIHFSHVLHCIHPKNWDLGYCTFWQVMNYH